MSFIGDLVGAGQQAKADKEAAAAAMTGYNYLNGQSGVQSQVAGGNAANTAEQQLLGLAAMTSQTQTGLNNYLNSTGYNFNLQQGSNAITGNAASRGILNSGSTGKALTQYGQNLGTSYFNNYLSSLGGVVAQGNQIAGNTAQAGTQGGATAAQAYNAMGNAVAGGTTGAIGNLTGSASQSLPLLGF